MGAGDDIEHRIAALADAQHGVVRRSQLLGVGLGERAIAHRVGRKRLRLLYKGVYALGHAELRREGRWLAAALACGDRAVLSHRSAAALWGLMDLGENLPVEVTVPTATARRHAGVQVYRHAGLRAEERTEREGIPVTTVARTLLDLAVVLRRSGLRRAVERAEREELFDLRSIQLVLDAQAGRPGVLALRAVVEDLRDHGVTFTRSELEARFLEGCIERGLPRPHVNRMEDGRELDFHWPDARLVVEANGFRYHRSPAAFERDHAKRFALEAAGLRVVSLTWRQVVETPDLVFERIRGLLEP
jgi:hypothetical protein